MISTGSDRSTFPWIVRTLIVSKLTLTEWSSQPGEHSTLSEFRCPDFVAHLYTLSTKSNSTVCCSWRRRQSWTCSTQSTLSKVGDLCRLNVKRPFRFVASVYGSNVLSTLSPVCTGQTSFPLCRQCVRGQSKTVNFVETRSTLSTLIKLDRVQNSILLPVCAGPKVAPAI